MISPLKSFFLGTMLAALPAASLALTVYFTTHPVQSPLARLATPDFSTIESTSERKNAFFEFFTPLAREQNERVRRNRGRLLAIEAEYARTGRLTPAARATLRRLAQRYNVDWRDTTREEQFDVLRRRLDEIPVSLVLAQAATESAWGTSRFAVDGNNFFGQWCYRKGCGLVPERRPAGASHEVAYFKNARAAVDAYYRNINTHRAYRRLREIRADLRAAGKPVTSHALVQGLGNYSERGQAYINELLEVINYNNLTERDLTEGA